MRKAVFKTLLGLCMVFAMLPLTGTSVYAAGSGNSMQSGTDGITGYSSTNGYNYVYYGMNGTVPIKWRVLSMNGNGGTYSDGTRNLDSSKAMFLLSEDLLANDLKYGERGTVVYGQTREWQNSNAQNWCKVTFFTNDLSAKEQAEVLQTTKTDVVSGDYSAASLSAEKAFFLSASEADSAAYGLSTAANRIVGTSPFWWWLRSTRVGNQLYAGCISNLGGLAFCEVEASSGARPAMNLNLSNVLFSSAAVGSKSGAVGASALRAVTDNATKEWKLTLKDSSRAFAITDMSSDGRTLKFSYEGATMGDNDYISAVVVGAEGNVKYYGRIAKPAAANGTVNVDLPADFDNGNDTLSLFSDQCNGDCKTDYASALQNVMMFKTTNTLKNITTNNTAIYKSYTDDSDYTETLSADRGYALPDSITVKLGDAVIDPASGMYTYDRKTGKVTVKAEYFEGDIEIIASGSQKSVPDAKEEATSGPSTGDTGEIGSWLALLGLAAVAAACILNMKEKKRNA